MAYSGCAGGIPVKVDVGRTRGKLIKPGFRVKSLTAQRVRELSRQREKELLLIDVLSGLQDAKAGRVCSEAEFRRWNGTTYDHTK
jgi:hypothetical protein